MTSVSLWAVGMTTAPRKLPTLEQSIHSLADAGWNEPRLFVEPETEIPGAAQSLPISLRDETLGAFPNWYLALTELVLRQPLAEAYFLCQDDVLFASGLRGYLEQRLWPARKVGVVSIYCPSHYANEKSEGFHLENHGWDNWGALAYIFPNSSARKFLSDLLVLNHRGFGPAEGMRNIDSVVGLWCQRSELNYFVHTPSLAQHIGDTSTIWMRGSNRGRRRAREFCEKIDVTGVAQY
ncbi:hypothetical protein [Gimesia aquarii]|uniref:Glycosyltransferase family 25 (LPS biosynthesis protein) n=1 Tax=Gimesia aquarii TaxID=2527964 RepID=A0A517WX38_9PLAN|nr:hypothetical protein [Gimesia aquarii]QDU09831.1 hypothetical protein V202x_32280 [Gimesia aquarii]